MDINRQTFRLRSKLIDYVVRGRYNLFEIANCDLKHEKCIFKRSQMRNLIRFLIIDEETAYHIGASLKDAGKKCFGISRIEDVGIISDILQRLEIETEEANN